MSHTVTALDLVRADLKKIQPGAEVAGHHFPARLLANESSLNPTFLLRQALNDLENLEPNRYWLPEVSTPLLSALSQYTGFAPEWILLGNGADELIQATMLTFLKPGDTVVIPWPSYPMYPYLAEVLGFNVVKVPLRADFSLDTEAILAAAAATGAPMIILSNPNNPTGNLFAQQTLHQLLTESKSMVVVDEAYFEYVGESVAPWLKDHDRVVVWRTFSKAFSLAGMRIGYLLAQPQVVNEIYKARLPFDISNLSQWLAKAALAQRAVFQNHVQVTTAERERVRQQLALLPGVTVYPSVTNFLLFKTTLPAPDVHAQLRDGGVLIRHVEPLSPLLAGCLRVSIGSPGENDLFVKTLKGIMSKHS